MATTATLTGTFALPNDAAPDSAVLSVTLSAMDTDQNTGHVLPDDGSFTVALVAGAIPAGQEIWKNTAGLRGTHYRATLAWTASDGRLLSRYLGSFQVGDDASYDMADLLDQPPIASLPEGWYSTLTQGDYDAAITARDEAVAARDQIFAEGGQVTLTGTQTLTNKTLSSPTITGTPVASGITDEGRNNLASALKSAQSFDTLDDFLASPITSPNNTALVMGQPVIADAAGPITATNGRKWRPAAEFNAAMFGFSATGTAAENAAAVKAAIIAANGREVIVEAAAPYLLSGVETDDVPVNLVFRGAAVDNASGATVLTHRFAYTNVQDVSEITTASVSFGGSFQGNVTRITVEDGTAYAVNDVLRLVSDDLDPYTDGTRRKGCHIVVAEVDGDYVYTAGRLDDTYVTAARVAKMAQTPCKITGLKVTAETLDNSGQIIALRGAWEPEIAVTVTGAGRIVVNSIGSYCGNFDLTLNGIGWGYTDTGAAAGNLAYGINDVAGTSNRVRVKSARGMRHATTTNSNGTDAGSTDIAAIGATRFHTVQQSTARSCRGAAFDEHAAARHTRWVDCTVDGGLRNNSALGPAPAFVARGIGASIVNPTVRTTGTLVVLNSDTRGTITVDGGYCDGQLIDFNEAGALDPSVRVVIKNLTARVDGTKIFIPAIDGLHVTIQGGTFTVGARDDAPDWSGFAFGDGGSVTLSDPEFIFEASTAADNTRLFRVAAGVDDVRISGTCKVRILGAFGSLRRLVSTEGTNVALDLIVDWSGGKGASVVDGTPTIEKYQVNYDDGTVAYGEKGNGWIRHANGLLECWAAVDTSSHAITTADGPFWKSDAAVEVVFPVAFQAKPAVCVTMQNSNSTGGLLHRGNSAVSTLGFSAQFWALSSTTVTTLRWAYRAVGQ